jgi:hypothetical protein
VPTHFDQVPRHALGDRLPAECDALPGELHALPDNCDEVPDVQHALPVVDDALPDVSNQVPDVSNQVPDAVDGLPGVFYPLSAGAFHLLVWRRFGRTRPAGIVAHRSVDRHAVCVRPPDVSE